MRCSKEKNHKSKTKGKEERKNKKVKKERRKTRKKKGGSIPEGIQQKEMSSRSSQKKK